LNLHTNYIVHIFGKLEQNSNPVYSNSSGNSSFPKRSQPAAVYVLLYFFSAFLVILTVCGNLLVIISISHFRQLHTPTNILILSLAVADLLLGIFGIPFAMIKIIENCWYFGEIVCLVYNLIAYFLTSVSISNLVFIAVDRYIALCDPLRYTSIITVYFVSFFIALGWAFSLAYTIIIISMSGVDSSEGQDGCPHDCFVILSETCIMVDLIITFILPFSAMIILYFKVFTVAKKMQFPILVSTGTHCSSWSVCEVVLLCLQILLRTTSNKIPNQGNWGAPAHFWVMTKLYTLDTLQLHTPTNILILSLAVADLLLGIFGIPFAMIKIIENCWYFGEILCLVYKLVAFFLTSVSISNLVFIAVDRYIALCDPLRYTSIITVYFVSIFIALGWAFSLVYNVIIISMNRIDSSEGQDGCQHDCFVILSETFIMVDLIITFILPFSVMIILYFKIFTVAKKRHLKIINSVNQQICTKELHQNKRPKNSERKAAKTLGIVISVYFICWVPFYTCKIIYTYTTLPVPNVFFNVLVWLIYFNSGMNPIIYALFYPWFKKSVHVIFIFLIPSES
uniref:G-protein coupled receptors family 1 profile domain-containing protein n=1 Tax=Erpetoichthys calabaricus TaxID=27687 RepID=A0A8C4RKM6_ERPCA